MTKEDKKKIFALINSPENQLRGMTEAMGWRILDALYTIIEMLHNKNSVEQNKESY